MNARSSAPPSLQPGMTIAVDATGELVARKVVLAADAARLQHEVDVLARLQGLDVVTASALDGKVHHGVDHAWVDLVHLDAKPLADAIDGPPARLLSALASVARTVEAAHARGVSHGRLDRTHILLVGTRTVVCGWSDAGLRSADQLSPNSHAPDSHLPDNHLPDNHQPDSHPPDSHLLDGHLLDGHLPDNHLPDNHQPDSHPPDGHLLDGHLPDSHAPDSHQPDSHRAVGGVSEGSLAAIGSTFDGDRSDEDGTVPTGVEREVALGSPFEDEAGPGRHDHGEFRGGGTVPGWAGAPFDPISDVAALGELCFLAAQHRSLTGRMRTQLTAVATIARHPDPAVRPPMSELARVLGRQDPGDPNSGDIEAPGPAPRTRTGPALRWPSKDTLGKVLVPKLLLGGATALVAAVLTTMVLSSGSTSVADVAGPTASAASSGDTSLEPATAPGTGEPATGATPAPGTPAPTEKPCPTTAEELALVGLPRTCLQPLAVTVNANLVRIGELHYEVGGATDQVMLADLSCGNKLVAVLLQPADGGLYVYDQWASAEHPSNARPLAQVAGAVGFSEPVQLTCGPVSVVGPDGTVTPVGGIR